MGLFYNAEGKWKRQKSSSKGLPCLLIKTVATQTDLTKEKNCLLSKAADASLSSMQDLVTFARNIPDLMASLQSTHRHSPWLRSQTWKKI